MFLTVNGGGNGLRFGITTGGNGAEQDLTGGGQLPLNTWSHVAVTLSGTTGTLYLNGRAVATAANMTLKPSSLGSTNQNWIGRSQYPDPYLNGAVDDFAIYDHALPADEVAALADGQAAAGDVADYKFDEAGGGTALDSSGHARNAAIISAGSAATTGTPLWQPEPDGPITIPAGSTTVPVTSIAGFKTGQQVALGHGSRFEVATVTAVGKPGTQARLTAPAPAGTTTLRVTSAAAITPGDRIRLDIGSRMETVTVAAVTGATLSLAAPLTFGHSANLPFSARGTGISFAPATRYPHSSNEPVQALGGGIVLDRPLARAHPLDTPIRDAAVTTAGYQGTPDEWFGGPALSPSAGSMVLRDRAGLVADSLNYGLLVDPWAAEGGCAVATPAVDHSVRRTPDGTDTDDNCADFATSLDPGPRVSLQNGLNFIKHDDADDLVVIAPVGSALDRQDATWVQTAGLADPACYSFESINQPGSYLRHQNFQVHLQPNDGSALFAQDATFCPQGSSFRSVNYPDHFLRAFGNTVYLAVSGGSNPWDTATSFAADTTWQVAPPWVPAT